MMRLIYPEIMGTASYWVLWLSVYFMPIFHSYRAKSKIIFVSPYLTNPKKLPLPKKFYCNFSYKIIFLLLLITERQKFYVLEGYIELLSDNAFNDSLLGKYYFCNQVLAILEQLKTNFNLYKT